MAQISRSTKVNGGTTLTASTTARAADVETDMATLVSAHNNHDSGASSWTVLKASGATSVPLDIDNSSGTQNIVNLKDNGSTVVSVADGGAMTIAPSANTVVPFTVTNANGGTNKTAIINNGTSTGNILEVQDNGTARLTVADGGTVTLGGGTLAMGSQKITGLANGTVSTDAVAVGQLKVREVTMGATSGDFSTTSATPVVITGNTVTVTPASTSSRFKLTWAGLIRGSAGGNDVVIRFTQGGGSISAFYYNNGALTRHTAAGVYIHSPVTTSPVTYDVRISISAGATVSINDGTQAVLIVEELYS